MIDDLAYDVIEGDCMKVLETIKDNSMDCCVTSPPYWQLRDYFIEGQLGNEESPFEYIDKLVAIFHEVIGKRRSSNRTGPATRSWRKRKQRPSRRMWTERDSHSILLKGFSQLESFPFLSGFFIHAKEHLYKTAGASSTVFSTFSGNGGI